MDNLRGIGVDAGTLVIGISSRALFDLRESHEVFERQGLAAYSEYQIAREDKHLEPGVAFPLVRKLLALNADDAGHPRVEVILLSRNSADTGLRIFNTIEHFGLNIERAAFTNGQSPWKYMEAFGADLLLSTNAKDVRRALESGHAAATILPGRASEQDNGQLRIAFDGDAVLFGDEAERIYQERGLEAFAASERQAANQPLSGGPFKHQRTSPFPADLSSTCWRLSIKSSRPFRSRTTRSAPPWSRHARPRPTNAWS
jgi:5'-nucleotidase